MAIREVRTYFVGFRRQEERSLNQQLGQPFSFYMDAVMRGRFKEYSGVEMKGINIVNLHLHNCQRSPDSGPVHGDQVVWAEILNVYQKHIHFDFNLLVGTREEKISYLVDTFVLQAEDSPKPQMQKLIQHVKECKGLIDIKEVIQRAEAYMTQLRESIDPTTSAGKVGRWHKV
jgi:hypothetical protein